MDFLFSSVQLHYAINQFFLEHFFLQLPQFRLFFCLAACAVDADFVDDTLFSPIGPAGGMAAAALSALGGFCRIFESGRVDFELKSGALQSAAFCFRCCADREIKHLGDKRRVHLLYLVLI